MSEDGHQPLDRLQHARHAAEGERRRAERHHFPIVRARVPPDDLNRIGGRVRMVEVGVQAIERGLERGAGGQRLQRASTYIIWTMRRVLPARASPSSCCSSPWRSWRRRAYLRSSLPQLEGTVQVSGHLGARRHHPRSRRRDARLRGHEARHLLRARLRARAGSPLADGISAPRRPRRGCPRSSAPRPSRRIGFFARSAPAAPRARRGTRSRLTRRTR